MIIFHSFFCKSHPRYLDKAVGMMREMNGCGFFDHSNFETFVYSLRQELKEGTGGRYDKGDVTLFRAGGQLQIGVKRGLDYAARIDYITVEKMYAYRLFSREKVQAWKLEPNGNMKSLWKDE